VSAPFHLRVAVWSDLSHRAPWFLGQRIKLQQVNDFSKGLGVTISTTPRPNGLARTAVLSLECGACGDERGKTCSLSLEWGASRDERGKTCSLSLDWGVSRDECGKTCSLSLEWGACGDESKFYPRFWGFSRMNGVKDAVYPRFWGFSRMKGVKVGESWGKLGKVGVRGTYIYEEFSLYLQVIRNYGGK